MEMLTGRFSSAVGTTSDASKMTLVIRWLTKEFIPHQSSGIAVVCLNTPVPGAVPPEVTGVVGIFPVILRMASLCMFPTARPLDVERMNNPLSLVKSGRAKVVTPSPP